MGFETDKFIADRKREQAQREVLKMIELVWNRFPQLRLGQLLINATAEDTLYHKTNQELTTALAAYLGEHG